MAKMNPVPVLSSTSDASSSTKQKSEQKKHEHSVSESVDMDLDTQAEEEKRIGRTPDGTTFVVPETHDMVSQLFDPRQPHNISDAVVVAVNLLLIYALYMLPPSFKQSAAALTFLFWRACYNVGIGWLLYKQSTSRLLTTWAKKSGLFDCRSRRNSGTQSILKAELEKKIPEDYKFEDAPVEYNTWLLFRKIVDLVLMCDFTSYCLFAIACSGRPEGEDLQFMSIRWTVGVSLILFNIWVKRDAHRVVKDYAWYWGDFFYLTNAELTFDGVFKLFPHPMYSVGYIGYYGISLLAASYKVLLISVIAHMAQLIFLHYVETPHIEKTYPSPASSKEESGVHFWDLS